MASTDCISWVLCAVRTESLRCTLPKFSLDTTYNRRGQNIPWSDDGCRRHEPITILFNYLCSVFYWARKNVGIIDPKCAQSTADKRRICLKSSVPHKNEVSPWTTHGALYEAKAFSTPEKPPLAVAWIIAGGCFFLPFISGNLHCS